MVLEEVCKTLLRFDTEYSADSCEYSPNLGVLATGTYQVNKLDPNSESPATERLGRIYIHNIDVNNLDILTQLNDKHRDCTIDAKENTCDSSNIDELLDKVDNENSSFTPECQFECPAVLDLKWTFKDPVMLGAVHASGQLVLYKCFTDCEGEDIPRLEVIEKLEITEDDGLALALEWNSSYDKIVVSDSKGKIHVVEHTPSNSKVIQEYSYHGYEAWTCCFSHWDDNIIFSGGDDCCFNCYDLRVAGSVFKKNSKSHMSGVTAMISDVTNSNQIITGSYDENVRWWDERNLKYELSSIQVGGGVWRIKQRPSGKLLIGGMHAGYCVIQDQHIIARYTEHESLAYGADWITDNVAASASFYDHLLTIWSL